MIKKDFILKILDRDFSLRKKTKDKNKKIYMI